MEFESPCKPQYSGGRPPPYFFMHSPALIPFVEILRLMYFCPSAGRCVLKGKDHSFLFLIMRSYEHGKCWVCAGMMDRRTGWLRLLQTVAARDYLQRKGWGQIRKSLALAPGGVHYIHNEAPTWKPPSASSFSSPTDTVGGEGCRGKNSGGHPV